MSYILVLALSSNIDNQAYVIDYNLTKQDCYERLQEENSQYINEHMNDIYKDAVARYKASVRGVVKNYKLSCRLS